MHWSPRGAEWASFTFANEGRPFHAICAALALLVGLLATDAKAQGQADEVGKALGLEPKPPASPVLPLSVRKPVLLDHKTTLRAGQTTVLRAGASSLGVSRNSTALTYKLGSKPECGEARETSHGILLVAGPDCVGQKLHLNYEVGLDPALGGAAVDFVRVDVLAVVERGIESCGIPNAPFEFIEVPAGTYPLRNAPSQIADLVKAVGKPEVRLDAFCISEETVPADEMDAHLAVQPHAQKKLRFPEALEIVAPTLEVEQGRGVRAPAAAVSQRMAKSYAQNFAATLERQVDLPLPEHYAAAALHLLRTQPDTPTTHSFLVSLRGGLIEWTNAACPTAADAFIVLGTNQQLGQMGELDRYCYEPSQRVSRMGFRLIMSMGRPR